MTQEDRCRLYILSPEKINVLSEFIVLLEKMFQAGDVACFQLRLKGASEDSIMQTAQAILPICIQYDVAFILNDNAKLAQQVGADGVHLGQADGNVAEARALLGHDSVIGVTCHDSKHLAYEAGEAGADYVAFGAFYDSTTKDSHYRPSPDILTDWSAATELPCVAIGGITTKNCQSLVKAGAHFIAASGSIWNYEKGPIQAVIDFNKVLDIG